MLALDTAGHAGNGVLQTFSLATEAAARPVSEVDAPEDRTWECDLKSEDR